MKTIALAAAAAGGALALAGCGRHSEGSDRVGAGADWTYHGGGVDESGFSRLEEIDVGEADRLGLAWSLDLPGEVTLEATPLAVDGVLYFSGAYSAVYAVDAASGKLLWKHDPEIWKHEPERMCGALLQNGMPRFDSLSDAHLRQLRAYIRSRAREVLGRGSPTPKAKAARY